jgi:hypothetical protein
MTSVDESNRPDLVKKLKTQLLNQFSLVASSNISVTSDRQQRFAVMCSLLKRYDVPIQGAHLIAIYINKLFR